MTKPPNRKTASRRKPQAQAGTVIPGPRLALSSPLYYNNKQHKNRTEEPFFITVLKVGLTLAVLCTVTFCVFSYQTLLAPSVTNTSSRNRYSNSENDRPQPPPPLRANKHNKRHPRTKSTSTHSRVPPFIFTLGPDAAHDAFAVAAKYNLTVSTSDSTTNSNSNSNENDSLQAFVQHAASIRKEFVYRYGASEIPARSILERGLSHMHSSQALAQRIQMLQLAKHKPSSTSSTTTTTLQSHSNRDRSLRKRSSSTSSSSPQPLESLKNKNNHKKKNEFVVLVVGSSAAAGYGNAHEQSYPFQLQDILRRAFRLQGLELVVRSLAMEDTSEFPLAWCLPHYTKTTTTSTTITNTKPDVVIWDFGGDTPPARLEAFLRVTANLWNNNNNKDKNDETDRFPFFMFREGSVGSDLRSRVIQYYMDANILVDPVVIRHSQAAQPFLTLGDMDRPDGLQKWREFGITGPSQSRWLLSLQEHEMIAWLISMHLLTALELVAANEILGENQVLMSSSSATSSTFMKIAAALPPPLSKDFQKFHGRPWESLVRGEYDPNSLHCYTSFDFMVRNAEMEMDPVVVNNHADYSPDTTIASNLDELIVVGTIGQATELLLPKAVNWFAQGWVLDLDAPTRRSKLLMRHDESSNFLGFPDWKQAYYGAPQSGALKLFVPIGTDASLKHAQASNSIDLLVLCESDALQESGSCTLRKDTTIRVGGKLATIETMDTDIVASFEKQTCIQVLVPPDATLSKSTAASTSTRAGSQKSQKEVMYGLPIEIQVTNSKVTWSNGPCSVAHVIFQRADTIYLQ
jgi:hypothetical protein